MKLEGAKVLITGASSGIGAALAPILAERGATVGIVARRADRSQEVLDRCRRHAPDSQMWAADLGDLDRAEEVALEAWDAFGGLDALVNNAAIPKRTRVTDLTPADVTHLMDVDFHSPVRMSLAVLPRMIERGDGTIVYVSSMGGRIPIGNEAAYYAAKFAMCGWAEAMYLDLAGTGVTIKLVLPGPIATEIWDQPGNEAALIDVEKVPAEDCAAGIADALEDDGFEYYVPADVPRRHRRQAARRRQARALRRLLARHGRLHQGTPRRRRLTRRTGVFGAAGGARNTPVRGLDGCELDRDAVEHGIAGERVEQVGAGEDVAVRAGACTAATSRRVPGRSWPQPWGRLTTPGRTASVTSTGTTISPAADRRRTRRAVGDTSVGRVVGVDVQRAAVLALHEDRQVVHPRVVRTQVAPADEDELRMRRVERDAQTSDVVEADLPARARSCRSACAAPRGSAAAAGRSRCRADSLRAARASGRRDRRRTRRRRDRCAA